MNARVIFCDAGTKGEVLYCGACKARIMKSDRKCPCCGALLMWSGADESCGTCVYWHSDVRWCQKREKDMPEWEGCDEYLIDPVYLKDE
jgi:hypothetical protein